MTNVSWNTAMRKPKMPAASDPEDPESLTDSGVATAARIFLNWIFRYRTAKRAELERGWNRARLYDASKQWLQPFRRAGAERYWYSWEPLRITGKGDLFPRPVRNIFSPAMQDEVSRLVGVGRKPYVRLDDKAKEEGKILSQQVLAGRNEDDEWELQQRAGCYHASMYGQWIHESRWEINKVETVPTAPTKAVKCQTCDFNLKSPILPVQAAQQRPSSTAWYITGADPLAVNQKEAPTVATALNCPDCLKPLEAWDDIPRDTWQQDKDSVGRPLADKQPLGEDITRVRSPYDFFPDNQGVGYMSAKEMMAWGYRGPKSVQWVKCRYQNVADLEHEMQRDIEAFAHHPIMLSNGMGYMATFTDGIWDGWGMLDEYYQKPDDQFPDGRALVMWGNRLLLNAGYYHPGTQIARCNTEVAQWELRDGEIWGKSLAEDLFSVQDNINARRSQSMNQHQKFTDPKILIHEGMDFQFQGGENQPYASDIWKINTRGIPPEIAQRFPMFFGNQGVPGSTFQEEDRDREHVATASGARDAEVGNVQGVELNYSALLFAATKSAERRKPRVTGIRRLLRNTWRHRLQNVAYFYREDRLIHYRDDSSEEAVKQVRGFMLQGQTDVQLEDEPLVDSAIALRASIEQALKWGTIKTSANGGSYASDRQINRAVGVPENLSAERDAQEEDAAHEWEEWLEGEYEPVVDPYSDDHGQHAMRHQADFEGRDAKKLIAGLAEQGIMWGRDVILPTWEWPRLLKQLLSMRQVASQPPTVEMMQKAMLPPPEIQKNLQLVQQARQALLGFPAPLELQIYNVWKRLLVAGGNTRLIDPGDGELIWPLHVLVRFKAHWLAHVLIASGQIPLGFFAAPPPAGALPPGQPPQPQPDQMAAIGGGAPPGGAGAPPEAVPA